MPGKLFFPPPTPQKLLMKGHDVVAFKGSFLANLCVLIKVWMCDTSSRSGSYGGLLPVAEGLSVRLAHSQMFCCLEEGWHQSSTSKPYSLGQVIPLVIQWLFESLWRGFPPLLATASPLTPIGNLSLQLATLKIQCGYTGQWVALTPGNCSHCVPRGLETGRGTHRMQFFEWWIYWNSISKCTVK